MELNSDFSQRVLIHTDALAWTPSPTPGVERRMLDRIGNEVARATSIVRYAAGTSFPPHTHGGGEEFLVLDGVFQDEHGDYPAGTYVRNPPGTRHQPRSDTGCTIFVKLWQFDPSDQLSVVADVMSALETDAETCGTIVATTLFDDGIERVSVESWPPDVVVTRKLPAGGEVLVLNGSITESGEVARRHSWLRIPPDNQLTAVAGARGARLWVKEGAFRH